MKPKLDQFGACSVPQIGKEGWKRGKLKLFLPALFLSNCREDILCHFVTLGPALFKFFCQWLIWNCLHNATFKWLFFSTFLTDSWTGCSNSFTKLDSRCLYTNRWSLVCTGNFDHTSCMLSPGCWQGHRRITKAKEHCLLPTDSQWVSRKLDKSIRNGSWTRRSAAAIRNLSLSYRIMHWTFTKSQPSNRLWDTKM